MKAYDASSTIAAAPGRGAAILTDATWDSGVERVDGGPSFNQFATGLKKRAENGA